MLRFTILFPLLLLVLFVLELLPAVEQAVVMPWTRFVADLSGWIMGLLDDDVVVHGNVIASASTGYGIAVVRGCNGIEAVIVLVSAMLAFPARWRDKLVGIAVGFVCIQSLNLVRIISLYYLNNWNQAWFEWFHLYVWQALIIVDALVVFLIWLAWIRRRQPPTDDADVALNESTA